MVVRQGCRGILARNPRSGTADVAASKLVTVPVSITESLFSASRSVMVANADMLVQVLPR